VVCNIIKIIINNKLYITHVMLILLEHYLMTVGEIKQFISRIKPSINYLLLWIHVMSFYNCLKALRF